MLLRQVEPLTWLSPELAKLMSRQARHRVPKQILFFFLIAASCLILDQSVKHLVHARLANASSNGPTHYITLTVPEALDGQRLDDVLAEHFSWSSRQEVEVVAEHYTRRLGGLDMRAQDRVSAHETLRVEHRTITILPDHLKLELHHNDGASFDLGTQPLGLDSKDLGIFGLFIFAASFLSLALFDRWRVLSSVGLGALAGGSLANALDRLFRGYVIDYIETPYLPPFNLADVLIGLGGACIVLSSIWTLMRLVRIQKMQWLTHRVT